VRVQDGGNVAVVNKGMGELVELKERLRGVVDVEAGERLWWDTRVR